MSRKRRIYGSRIYVGKKPTKDAGRVKRMVRMGVFRLSLAIAAETMEVTLKLKMIGLLAALVFAAPVAAVAGPAGGLTAQAVAPAIAAPAVETNAAVTPGTSAKVEKVWWRGGYGWRRGYGFRRFGYGYRRPFFGGYYGYRRPFFGGYYGYGFRRPFFRRRFFF